MPTRTTTTAIAIAVPLLGYGLIYSKLQKHKKNGRLTSISSLIKTIPMRYRTARYMFVQTKIKNNEYLKKLQNIIGYDNYILSDHWTARETDVICAVPLKSGTTWAQQICQQLRVNGESNINFNQDIHDVQPWIETRLTQGFGPDEERPIPCDPAAGPGAYDMDADQAESPIRVYKSHLTWESLVGTNCKKLFVYRKSVDAAYSLYYFMMKILEMEGDVNPHAFMTTFLMNSNFFEKNLKNLCDFWDHRKDPNVGFFFYDDMKEDHAGSVKRIAELMDIEASQELIEKVVSQSTAKFMGAEDHHLRFDGFTQHAVFKRALGLEYTFWPEVSGQLPRREIPNVKVTKSATLKKRGSEHGRAEVEECYRKTWKRIVLPRTGFASPDEMRAAWKKELSQ